MRYTTAMLAFSGLAAALPVSFRHIHRDNWEYINDDSQELGLYRNTPDISPSCARPSSDFAKQP